MLGRVAAVAAPGVVLLAAGAFAGHQIRIRAAQAGRLHRFVHVEHDLVLGGLFDHVLMMPDHVLAVVPFADHLAGVVDALETLRPVDVAGLHGGDAEPLVEREGIAQLAFVVGNRTAGFVVADEMDALRLGVARRARRGRNRDTAR